MNYRLTFYKYEIEPFWLRKVKLHQKQSPLQHNGDCFFAYRYITRLFYVIQKNAR